MLPSPFPIAPELKSTYTRLRLLLWGLTLFGGGAFFLSLLFPTITQSFDFRNPGASRNSIVDPQDSDHTPLTNGKLANDQTLQAYTSLLGDFSAASIAFTLEQDSAFPESIPATLKRTYRAMLLPVGEPIAAVQPENILHVQNTYYVLKNDTLYPFVSDAAYHSRFGDDQPVKEVDPSVLTLFTLSNQPIGFRIGSLLSFADGVFIVTSNTEIRPVGSAEIFLALGYRFEDVVPVSEEDLGIYTRGRIILLNTPHADGTLFRDNSTGDVYLIEQGFRRLVQDTEYLRFLESKQLPIGANSADASETVTCTLQGTLFPRTYRCTALLENLNDNLGNDYELTLGPAQEDYEMRTLSLAFDTHVTLENAHILAAKVKNRILTRFGLGS